MPRAVILTALPVEYLSVRSHLSDPVEEVHPKGTIYERGHFSENGQTWEIGIVEIGAGNSGTALEAERAIEHFNPSIILFVGVAGGIKDVKLGDVVASTKVYGYESGKAEDQFQPRPGIGLSNYSLEHRAKAEARKSNWRERLESQPPHVPNVIVAPIAAGEKVISSTSSDIFRFIRNNYGDVAAVEMEGIGFLQAAQANQQVSALIVRGISDLIENKDQSDNAGYQKIASDNASAFAFELLSKHHVTSSNSDNTKVVKRTLKNSKEALGVTGSDLLVDRSEYKLSQEAKSKGVSPRVFISYSHDSLEHKDKILSFANRMCIQGIDVHIDQYEDPPSEGCQRWMLNQIELSAYTLVVCTEEYYLRFRGREVKGRGKGVTFEGAIIMQELYDKQGENKKFIPIIVSSEDTNFIPEPLRSTSTYSLNSEEAYETLYRRLTGQPLVEKPKIGSIQPFSTRSPSPAKSVIGTSPPDDESFLTSGQHLIDFSWKELRELIQGFHEILKPSEHSEQSKFDLSIVDLEHKNELNGLSDNYFKTVLSHHEVYFTKIQRFLKNPANEEITSLYHEIVDELMSKLAIHRPRYKSFEEILVDFASVAKEQNSSTIRKRTLNILISFMYVNCDIGRKK